MNSNDTPFMETSIKSQGADENIFSIDRVPPMESHSDSEDLLISPTTDISTPEQPTTPSSFAPIPSVEAPKTVRKPGLISEQSSIGFNSSVESHPYFSKIESALAYEISIEAEWSGSFIRKVRQACKVSIEELCEVTKISRTYLMAIEDENFAKLPAPVYIRGFVAQMAKALKLPYDKVANAYLVRVRQNSASKE